MLLGHLALPLGLVALSVASSTFAFESREHERLANLAFHYAVNIHCPRAHPQSQDCIALRGTFIDPLDSEGVTRSEGLTYGEVVRCVDFFLTPEKMLAGREDDLFSPPTTSPRPNVLPESTADFRRGSFDAHCRDSVFNFAATQAAHSNHAHFQAELIASQNLYHRLAIGLRLEGKPFTALFVNAISDHYLHDFFAPGHIGTFRSHMSDIYSNTLHDLINARGASLHFTPSAYDELIGTLATLSSGGSAALNAIPLEDKAKTYLTCLPPKSALDKFMRSDDADICIDDEASKDKLAWLATVGNLEQLLRIVAADDTVNTRSLKMLGDNTLWKPSQRPQLVLMLALQIRSILDVLRAQKGNDNDNWFANGTWLSKRLPDTDGALIKASIDGRFEFRLRILPTGPGRDELAARVSQSGDQDAIEIAELHDRALQLAPRYFPPEPHEIVVSVGFNTEMPRFGHAQSRASVSLEAPVLAFLSLGNSKINYGMAAGAFLFKEGREWRSGVSLRPGFVLSQSETFVSVPLRWFHYRMDDGRSVWRPSWGFRVDQGFSSFMTVYLQYTNSPFRQEGDRIGRGLVFGAGVVFAAPLCRVPKLGGWLC